MPSPCLSDSTTVHLDDPGGVLIASVILSPNAGNAARDDGAGLFAPSLPVPVSSLPLSPADNTQVLWSVPSFTDHYWHMVAVSGTWYYVGGPHIAVAVDAVGTLVTGNNAWSDLSGAGPTLTLPMKGRWQITFGAEATAGDDPSTPSAAPKPVEIGIGIAGADPASPLIAEAYGSNAVISGVLYYSSLGHDDQEHTFTTAAALKMYYRTTDSVNGGRLAFRHRYLNVRPVYLQP